MLSNNAQSNLFCRKRLTCLATALGHLVAVPPRGEQAGYVKEVQRGLQVSRTELRTEAEWREALRRYFGITLGC